MRFGMSEKLGPRVLGRNHDMPFLGREMGAEPDYSEEIAREIDDEIRRVIEEAHERAPRVLREHMDELHQISAILIERETIDKDQFERLLAGETEEAVFPDEEPPAASRRRPSEAAAAAAAAAVPAAGRHAAAAAARALAGLAALPLALARERAAAPACASARFVGAPRGLRFGGSVRRTLGIPVPKRLTWFAADRPSARSPEPPPLVRFAGGRYRAGSARPDSGSPAAGPCTRTGGGQTAGHGPAGERGRYSATRYSGTPLLAQ